MVDSAAADRAAEKVRKLVALTASPHLEEARTSAYLACRLIREHGLQVSGHPPSTAFAPGYPTAGVPHRQPTADPHGFRRIRVRHPGHCRCCGKPIALGGVGALVPWQWPATSALHPLSRCSAEEIQQALRALLAGEAFLADRPWSEIWWWRMRLDLASGWQLKIAIERDQLGALLWAQAPDGRDWVYGCQRDDWTLGPDSRIVEPVALLKPEQRQQLEQLLREAICWPAPLVSCGWVMPMGKVKPSPYARRKGRSPVHRPVTSAGQCTTGRASKTGAPTPTPL